jgi:hypothetical protein
MKNLALENYGTVEMNSTESIEIIGGNPFLIGVAASICAYVIIEIAEGLARPCK